VARHPLINRPQVLVLGFFVLAWVMLAVILALSQHVRELTLRRLPGSGTPETQVPFPDRLNTPARSCRGQSSGAYTVAPLARPCQNQCRRSHSGHRKAVAAFMYMSSASMRPAKWSKS
jgi:hypothetical protein